MKTDSTSAYFNIHDVKDQSGAAIHRGEFDGPVAMIEVNEAATYLIRPFLVRAAARREESAEYTMWVDVLEGRAAAAQNTISKNPESVYDTTWEWVKTVTPVEEINVNSPSDYTVRLTGDGMAYLQIDCNKGQGTIKMSEGKVSFGPIAATRRACPEGSMGAQFGTYLSQVVSFFRQGDVLYLELPADAGTLHFRRAGSTDSAKPSADVESAKALLSPDEALTVFVIPVGEGKVLNDMTIQGYKSDAFALAVPKNTKLRVEMQSENTSAYFNVHDVRDQSGVAVHRSDVDGSVAVIDVPVAGTYLIRPYLFRNAARDGQTAKYTMWVDVLEGIKRYEAKGGPTEYNASGYCKCSSAEPTLGRECAFRVIRGETTEIWVVNIINPDDFRILKFTGGSPQDPSQGTFTAIGRENVKAQRVDDNWLVTIDNREFYMIPDAIIWGG
jgi:heat shock protein HslJ